MTFEFRRLRGGEWIIGAASLALVICLFALPWYGFKAVFRPVAAGFGPTDVNGWDGLKWLSILILLVGIIGMLTWWSQAARRAPALPVSATVVTAVLATLVVLGLIYRVLLDPPAILLDGSGGTNTIEAKSGAYIGLVLAAVVVLGGYLSLREDGIRDADAPPEIETLRLAQRPVAHAGS